MRPAWCRSGCSPVLAAAVLLLSTAACAVETRGRDSILLSAASDLAAALPELRAAFLAESGVTVTPTVGASGMLAQQILNGAPVDVFASADDAWIDRLEAAGRTVHDTRATYAYGELALVIADRVEHAATTLPELMRPEFGRIAIANPAFAPYGRAARQALERSGAWDAVQPRIVLGENVRQALEYVVSGNVDAAIVARSLVAEGTVWFAVPAELHQPLRQDVVVIRGTAREPAARRFVEFLTGRTGRAVLRTYHFTVPEQTS